MTNFLPVEEQMSRWGKHTFHSKLPEPAPEGFIRLAYADQSAQGASGPNYIYIQPEWVREAGELPKEGCWWVCWRDPASPRETLSAKIDHASYQLLPFKEEQIELPGF